MENERKIPLWQPIVGLVISDLAGGAAFFLFVVFIVKNFPIWLILLMALLFILGLVFWIINLVNLVRAIKQRRRKRIPAKSGEDKKELLHKLLSEGKITIDEYDELMKK